MGNFLGSLCLERAHKPDGNPRHGGNLTAMSGVCRDGQGCQKEDTVGSLAWGGWPLCPPTFVSEPLQKMSATLWTCHTGSASFLVSEPRPGL